MIEVEHLSKSYGSVLAINDIGFQVPQGEIVGFLGPNGAGKSTTMRILTGFMTASAGTARVAGHDVHAEPIEVKRRVGYMPERVPLYDEMVVSRFLHYVATIKGVGRHAQRAEVGEVVERCGLQGMENRLIGNLSKGYRQRVGLAQALVGAPPVLILDEPTAGLDPRQIIDIRQMVKNLGDKHTVLLSTHILPEVAMVCERVIIIDRGQVVAEDRMENLAGAQAGRWHLQASGNAERITAALQGVPGVASVTQEAANSYVVLADVKAGGGDTASTDALGNALAAAVAASGGELAQISRRTRSLEDVFLEAISADRGAAA